MSRDEGENSLALRNFRPGLKIDPFIRPIHRFMDVEASGGIVLVVATMIALFFANTSLAKGYAAFWQMPLQLGIGSLRYELSLLELVNDGLMTFFFFVVGLEIKREILLGELKTFAGAALPVIAAVGGLLVPALIYLAMEFRGPAVRGWAIPMATDIAFVVGFLSLLGKRVPHSLKIMLITLAIADDLGSVLVIAFAFAEGFAREFFLAGMGFYLLIFVMKYLGVRRILPYAILAYAMWICVYRSGVHPTMAGVLLGLAVPSARLVTSSALLEFLNRFRDQTQADSIVNPEVFREVGRESVSPLERLERDLHPWVSFFIMPIFALANAGVPLVLSALESSVAWAVILGLVIGKPLGIFGFSWLASRAKIPMPRAVTFPVLFAASCLCGIGFTISIFIAGLGLEGELLIAAKTGVLLGSALSAALGLLLLHKFLARREDQVVPESSVYSA